MPNIVESTRNWHAGILLVEVESDMGLGYAGECGVNYDFSNVKKIIVST